MQNTEFLPHWRITVRGRLNDHLAGRRASPGADIGRALLLRMALPQTGIGVIVGFASADGTNVALVGRAVDLDQGHSTAVSVTSPRTGRCSMRAGSDNDRDLLELAEETERVAMTIDDIVIRMRLREIAGELQERAIPIPA